MVDLHHHLLPGIDDGSPDLQTSLAMARMAAEDGITDIVCTPHASGRYAFDPAEIANRVNALRGELQQNDIPVTLATGCDFHLSYDNVEDALAHPRKYTINGTQYLLVELPDFGVSESLQQTFYELGRAGMIPILTHPERNLTLQRNPGMLAEWRRQGLLLQVTAGSVTGRMGKPAQRMAQRLLADRWVHFLATDAHNITSRPPRLSEARHAVARRHGEAYAQLLCDTNPLSVYKGRPLPEQPAPFHLFEDDEDPPGFWRRLLGRG